MGIMGLPVWEFITTEDQDAQSLLRRAHRQGGYVLEDLQDQLARKIVKETADAQERGKKKK